MSMPVRCIQTVQCVSVHLSAMNMQSSGTVGWNRMQLSDASVPSANSLPRLRDSMFMSSLPAAGKKFRHQAGACPQWHKVC